MKHRPRPQGAVRVPGGGVGGGRCTDVHLEKGFDVLVTAMKFYVLMTRELWEPGGQELQVPMQCHVVGSGQPERPLSHLLMCSGD